MQGVHILLTSEEARVLLGSSEQIRTAFASWGFTFADLVARSLSTEGLGSVVPSESPYAQVEVLSVPELIADKVHNFLRVLIILVLSVRFVFIASLWRRAARVCKEFSGTTIGNWWRYRLSYS
jgi:hypothetical protein